MTSQYFENLITVENPEGIAFLHSKESIFYLKLGNNSFFFLS
jgi:hypothetical protein